MTTDLQQVERLVSELEKSRSEQFGQVGEQLQAVSRRTTVDCVLLFIPNEHIYAFVHDEDHGLIEEALQQKVVLCSPITLFAVLAVVRQAVTNFQLEKRAGEMAQLMIQFYGQWKQYTEQFGKVEKKLGELQREFQELVTTRQRALERPLARIDALRRAGD